MDKQTLTKAIMRIEQMRDAAHARRKECYEAWCDGREDAYLAQYDETGNAYEDWHYHKAREYAFEQAVAVLQVMLWKTNNEEK